MLPLYSAFALIIMMTCAWIIYVIIKNSSIIDCFWSLGFILTSSIYLLPANTTTAWVVWTMILIWSLRLFIYLFITRILTGHIEQRYGSPASTSVFYFWLNFIFQGILVFILTYPLYLFSIKSDFNISHVTLVIFSCLQLLAIAAETISDLQLHRFRQQNQQSTCNTGLWYYSRHPNLFFDWLFWTLIALEIYSATHTAIITSILLYVIMNHLTIPITERQSLKRKGKDFERYQLSTSRFFLWFKKHG